MLNTFSSYATLRYAAGTPPMEADIDLITLLIGLAVVVFSVSLAQLTLMIAKAIRNSRGRRKLRESTLDDEE